eukprot:4381222-Prymnesium_polylepis.1
MRAWGARCHIVRVSRDLRARLQALQHAATSAHGVPVHPRSSLVRSAPMITPMDEPHDGVEQGGCGRARA